jgi:hypothetical protein
VVRKCTLQNLEPLDEAQGKLREGSLRETCPACASAAGTGEFIEACLERTLSLSKGAQNDSREGSPRKVYESFVT